VTVITETLVCVEDVGISVPKTFIIASTTANVLAVTWWCHRLAAAKL